jgi:hypothetical protein
VLSLQQLLALAYTAMVHVPPRWWRRPPFLPLPDRGWIRFRLETAYGDPRARPTVADLGAYSTWCAEMRHLRRASQANTEARARVAAVDYPGARREG